MSCSISETKYLLYLRVDRSEPLALNRIRGANAVARSDMTNFALHRGAIVLDDVQPKAVSGGDHQDEFMRS
jgi:hypothetical protein